jgi:hypothetical protein
MQWAEETANKGGRVIEILSEHTCQGFGPHLPPCPIRNVCPIRTWGRRWAQGYTLTGRYALFPSYETFLGIISTSHFIRVCVCVCVWSDCSSSTSRIATMMIQYAKVRPSSILLFGGGHELISFVLSSFFVFVL